PIPHGEVRDVLAAADVFCLPSHTEGFPLSLLEAMGSADAVVATAVGDVPEMLGDGEAGILVPPRDPASLADALTTLAADEARRLALGRAARARAEERYSRDRMDRELVELYRGLTRSRPRSVRGRAPTPP